MCDLLYIVETRYRILRLAEVMERVMGVLQHGIKQRIGYHCFLEVFKEDTIGKAVAVVK
jgi:hypothetical protein